MAKLSFEQYEKLKAQGLDDTQIQQLSEKYGYSMPKENILASAAKTLVGKPVARATELIGRTGILGENIQRGYQAMADEGEGVLAKTPFGTMNIEAQKSFGDGGGRQIAADALDSTAYLTPIKGGKIAKTALGVGSGYAADVSNNLRDGEQGADIFKPGFGAVGGAIFPNLGSFASGLKKGSSKATKYVTAQLTGLNPDTVTTLITRPNEVTKAQRAVLSRHTVAQRVADSFQNKLDELSATGKGYQTIRNTGGSVDVPPDTIKNVLSKYGIDVQNGKLVRTAESVPMKPGDIDDIERFIVEYGSETKLSSNAFLNARQAIDNMKAFNPNKSGVSKKIAAELRKAYDTIGKSKIKGLTELDGTYSKQRTFVEKAQKYLFDKDGNLTDSAINRIANATGKGKDRILERLEDLHPGITQQLQILKTLEDIEATGGQKVGTYMKALAPGALSGNVPLMIAGMFAASPSISVPIIKTYGRMNGFSGEVIEKVTEKLLTGGKLNGSELMLVRKAILFHIANLPSDKFDDEQEVIQQENDNSEIPTNN